MLAKVDVTCICIGKDLTNKSIIHTCKKNYVDLINHGVRDLVFFVFKGRMIYLILWFSKLVNDTEHS